MSELISYHLEDGIATLTLSNGKVNAISPDVIAAFNAALDQAVTDRAVVIITGQPGILSGGYDLKVMTSGPKEAVALVTCRLDAGPSPVVAPVPGDRGLPWACRGQGRVSAAVGRLSHRCRRPVQHWPERSTDRHDHAPRRYRAGP